MLVRGSFFLLSLGSSLHPTYFVFNLFIKLMKIRRRQKYHRGCDEDNKENLFWK